MEIKILKTFEIGDDLWKQIVDGYNASFVDHFTNKENLISGYISNRKGFSYHALCFELDKLIGFNSIIPYEYYIDNDIEILGLSGTTFVLKEFRKDIFIFNDMYQELKKACKNEGIIAFLGVPNSNSYQYSIKILKCKEVMNLSYYVLPVKFFNLIGIKYLSFLNFTTYIYSFLNLTINTLISFLFNFKERESSYRLFVDEKFLQKRFNSKRYVKKITDNHSFAYTIHTENNVKVAYIMDFRERHTKSFRSLLKVTWRIFLFEKVDTIMYIGTMNMKQCILTKIPNKFHPRNLPFTYNIIDNSNKNKYSDMSESKNWDFSLLNLDVR